jgi:hypothetical protein
MIVAIPSLAGFFGESNLIVADLVLRRYGDDFAGVRVTFLNEGTGRVKADYSIVFSLNPAIGVIRDYVVYSNDIRIGRNREATVEIDGRDDIEEFINENDVRIPPGNYRLSIVIDSGTMPPGQSNVNNRRLINDRFFYGGAAGVEVLDVSIWYRGQNPLDDANPLKVFIGNLSRSFGPNDSAQFRITREGRYFFPLDEVPARDIDGSGYYMMIVYDAGDDLIDTSFIGPGDVPGLYKEGTDNVVYGGFAYRGGSPMYPDELYNIYFSHPPSPAPDAYEIDDDEFVGTFLEFADLPIRQFHTFHNEKNGDADRDWFRIFLKSGDSLTVETFSAGGIWESDTRIDLTDSQMKYIGSSHDKSLEDRYSKLTYINDTGVDQIFHFLVKPFFKYGHWIHGTGEYIVEFRR